MLHLVAGSILVAGAVAGLLIAGNAPRWSLIVAAGTGCAMIFLAVVREIPGQPPSAVMTASAGVIRAFDIASGELLWNWDSGNPDDTAPLSPGQTYTPNSPNSWSISSLDEELGLVYVPLGNQPPDQWGGNRSESVERYSSSVVALDVATGAVRWVFQTVHHDLWDYDVPSQPTLVDIAVDGTLVPALVQPTKQGEIFVLDRRTGEEVMTLLLQAQRSLGASLVLVTHDPEIAQRCDLVLHLRDGRIVSASEGVLR